MLISRTRRIYLYALIAIIILIIIFGFRIQPVQDCEKYKYGKFYIYNKANRQRIKIERRDSLQVETNDVTGNITVLKVRWTGPCDYELLFNYTTPKELLKDTTRLKVIESFGVTPFYIKILSGTEDYYVFEARKEGYRPLRDTVWILKENASAFTK